MKAVARLAAWSVLVLVAASKDALAGKAPPLDREIDAFLSVIDLTPASAEAIEQRCDAALALAQRARTALEARKGRASIEGDFATYDTLRRLVYDVESEVNVVFETNPAAPLRDAAEACEQRLDGFDTAISLSRPIYDRLAAIKAAKLDATTRHTLDKVLAKYRLAGVDKDAATRAKVESLQKQITDISFAFHKNLKDDKGDFAFKPAELAGLPQDYLDAHKPGPDGLVHLTRDYPDALPATDYADNRQTRRTLYLALFNRGYPANKALLQQLLEKRHELARTLGYSDYAVLAMVDRMIGSPQRAAQFIDEANAAATPAASSASADMLALAKAAGAANAGLQFEDVWYLQNKLRKQKYDVDTSEVRRYLSYDKVRVGIFGLMRDLFGADIRPWNTPVWDKSVSAWELYDGDRLVGRFYLDMHPREGKYHHAAHFIVRTGVAGRQVPVNALICNLPAGGMEHNDMITFLHEFGHLIHFQYSGRVKYSVQSMLFQQSDFMEAPSQLLEEWAWDYDTLKLFATNAQGEPIPPSLVQRMNATRQFGQALYWKEQLGLSAVSLNYYNRKPDFDLDAMYHEQMARYWIVPLPEDAHFYASFGHLDGMSAAYYTYAWSKAIALDLFTKFRAAGIRNPDVAMQYRRQVLEPGGSADANDLIRAFLGRPFNTEAFKESMKVDAKAKD